MLVAGAGGPSKDAGYSVREGNLTCAARLGAQRPPPTDTHAHKSILTDAYTLTWAESLGFGDLA